MRMQRPLSMPRRGLALGLGLWAIAPRRAEAMLPGAATLFVPGPDDGPLSRWATRLATALARGATTAMALTPVVLGGPDGVTAANRFATEAAPDGRVLLVLPGAALHARLIGDPRARFDGAGWLPVCGAEGGAVVVGRESMPALGPALGPAPGRAPLRLALPAVDHPGAAALLACDLMGVAAVGVPGLAGAEAEAALAQGQVDAMLLQGAAVPARLAALGLRPWFSLDAAGGRDTGLPGLPSALEAATAGPPALRAALAAAAVHARLQAAVVLPALTPGNLVALWRAAAQRWLEEGRGGLSAGLRPLSGSDYPSLVVPPDAVLAYRGWLARRLGWRSD
jgi:hypothetical protein